MRAHRCGKTATKKPNRSETIGQPCKIRPWKQDVEIAIFWRYSKEKRLWHLFCHSLLAWVNRIDTFGNSWKTGFFGVINCYQASSGQILCQNTYSFHLNYSMYKEKTQHFYFKLSFSTSPFFAGLLTLLPLPLEEFFGSTFFRVIEVFSHPAVFLVDFRNDTIG